MTDIDLLIIGAGAAGLSCGKAAVSSGVKRVLIVDASERIGGILPQCLHKGFGLQYFGSEMSGAEFLDEMVSSLPPSLEIRLSSTVLSLFPDRTALISSAAGLERIRFRQLILATGCREVSLWSVGVGGTRPCGVYTAGLAQYLVNLEGRKIGERIVILGSGDVGLVMAGRFAELGNPPLAVIEKQPELGGLLRNRKRYVYDNHIPVMLQSTVETLHGNKTLTGITVRHFDSGKTERIDCDTLITALGLIPDRSLLRSISAEGNLPEWVHVTGNCDFVHDIVDRVLRDGERLGSHIAELF